MSSERPNRADFQQFYAIATRWADNDIYGHVNNVAYYAYFDTAANRFLIECGGLDIHGGDSIGLVVSSGCEYHEAITYPETIEVGVSVERLGSSSVRYGLAIFRRGNSLAAAHGHFTHVFVDRETRRSMPIPTALRAALATIQR